MYWFRNLPNGPRKAVFSHPYTQATPLPSGCLTLQERFSPSSKRKKKRIDLLAQAVPPRSLECSSSFFLMSTFSFPFSARRVGFPPYLVRFDHRFSFSFRINSSPPFLGSEHDLLMGISPFFVDIIFPETLSLSPSEFSGQAGYLVK